MWHFDGTKERALNSYTVSAKEKEHLSHGGPRQRQLSDGDPPMRIMQGRH